MILYVLYHPERQRENYVVSTVLLLWNCGCGWPCLRNIAKLTGCEKCGGFHWLLYCSELSYIPIVLCAMNSTFAACLLLQLILLTWDTRDVLRHLLGAGKLHEFPPSHYLKENILEYVHVKWEKLCEERVTIDSCCVTPVVVGSSVANKPLRYLYPSSVGCKMAGTYEWH